MPFLNISNTWDIVERVWYRLDGLLNIRNNSIRHEMDDSPLDEFPEYFSGKLANN